MDHGEIQVNPSYIGRRFLKPTGWRVVNRLSWIVHGIVPSLWDLVPFLYGLTQD